VWLINSNRCTKVNSFSQKARNRLQENKQIPPLVSVVIPCYNHEKYICDCIQSVIEQDYQNVELIIIDDGSKDDSITRIKSMVSACEKHFGRFEFRSRENKGVAISLNEGLSWAEGEYFTVIASDDLMAKHKISSLVSELENISENYAVAFGDANFIDDNGEPLFLKIRVNNRGKVQTNSFLEVQTAKRSFNYNESTAFGSYETLISGNYLPAMSFVVKTDCLKSVDGWMRGNKVEDWELWLKLAKKYKFSFVNKNVAFYRLHDSNSIYTNTVQLTLDTIKLLKREKMYAMSNGYSQQFYEGVASQDLSLLKLRSFFFIKNFVKNIFNFEYCKSFVKKIYVYAFNP